MTAAERVEEYESDGEDVPVVVVVPVPVPEELQGEAKEEVKEGAEEPTCVAVDAVITVDVVVVDDGEVKETAHEEVNVKQTFIPEEPMPYGPDESLTEEGKEDEEECGFCLFMKAGPCGKRFAAWEACVDDAETAGTNIVEKCAQKTHFLKDCMEANPEYYGPVLQAEKAIGEQQAAEETKTSNEEENPSNHDPIPA